MRRKNHQHTKWIKIVKEKTSEDVGNYNKEIFMIYKTSEEDLRQSVLYSDKRQTEYHRYEEVQKR